MIEVKVVHLEANRRYELDDLEEWLAEARPVLSRKQRQRAEPPDIADPFLEYARQYGIKRTDVEARLGT